MVDRDRLMLRLLLLVRPSMPSLMPAPMSVNSAGLGSGNALLFVVIPGGYSSTGSELLISYTSGPSVGHRSTWTYPEETAKDTETAEPISVVVGVHHTGMHMGCSCGWGCGCGGGFGGKGCGGDGRPVECVMVRVVHVSCMREVYLQAMVCKG